MKSFDAADSLDRAPVGHDAPLSALSADDLDRFIQDYAEIAHTGRDSAGVVLEQRDLDVYLSELQRLRAERYQRQRKDGAA